MIFRLAKMELREGLVDVNLHLTKIKSLINEDELEIYFTGDNKIQIDNNTSKETIKKS